MKIFKYKFTRLITALIFTGLALAVAAFALNLYFVLANGIDSAANRFYPILQYSLMFFVSVGVFVILLSLLLSSYYAVDVEKKVFKTSFGIIKSKYDISKIESILHDRTTEKLHVYFENQSFITIVVKKQWYNDFVEALLAANPKIEFSVRSKENTPDDENKKDGDK